MTKRKETVDIISEIVGAIDRKLVITSAATNGEGLHVLQMCDTGYLQECRTIEIDSVDYLIKVVDKDVSITLMNGALPTATEFDQYPFVYDHGTIEQTTKERESEGSLENKTPFIFLHEELKDRFYGEDEYLDRTTSMSIYFLSESKWNGSSTDDHYHNAIKPMKALMFKFLEKYESMEIFMELEDFDSVNISKFAYFIKGSYTTAVMEDDLSGCKLSFTMNRRKQNCDCTNACNHDV